MRRRHSVRAGVREEEARRRHYNRYVSMQTLSFIRLPVRCSGGDLPGPCVFPHRTQIQLFIDARRIDRRYLSNASRTFAISSLSAFLMDTIQSKMKTNVRYM